MPQTNNAHEETFTCRMTSIREEPARAKMQGPDANDADGIVYHENEAEFIAEIVQAIQRP